MNGNPAPQEGDDLDTRRRRAMLAGEDDEEGDLDLAAYNPFGGAAFNPWLAADWDMVRSRPGCLLVLSRLASVPPVTGSRCGLGVCMQRTCRGGRAARHRCRLLPWRAASQCRGCRLVHAPTP